MTLFSRIGNQRGVAMVTVLLVGAALTATASAAAYVTIQEFESTRADRTSAQALAYAEAGIDRLMLEIRKGNLTWNNISLAGCDPTHPKITLSGTIAPSGTYDTTLEVFNRGTTGTNRFIPAACSVATSDPLVPALHSFLLTSVGAQPRAKKIIRQVIDVKPLGLPVGIYAYDSIIGRGTINMENLSMITEGYIENRDNIQFSGSDAYFTLGAFYGSQVSSGNASYHIPAAAHAKLGITYGANSRTPEHPPNPNCDANKNATAGQSLWDGSVDGGAVTTGCTIPPNLWPGVSAPPAPYAVPSTLLPPTALFDEAARKRVAPSPNLTEQDYLTLRESAKGNGLYCKPAGTGMECLEGGVETHILNSNSSIDSTQIDHPNIPRSFVAYFDFPADGIVRKAKWGGNADVGPCSFDPALNRTIVIVVRNGNFDGSGNPEVTGALLIPEGTFESSGGFTMEGTIIARRFDSSGTVTFRLSECWVKNLPGPFLDVVAAGWSEVDR